jgi:DNA ligase D-like protein (predicted ligase)
MRSQALPTFIEPMLATAGEPFDSDEYLFEIKWDGFRAVCYVENGSYRLLGRRKTDFTQRFPELSPLKRLPAGSIVDGEIVAMVGGRPDFPTLLGRSGERSLSRKHLPATFVAFDLLYDGYQSTMAMPCEQRRARLAEILPKDEPRIVLSRSIIGDGMAYFEQIKAMGLEGMLAKQRRGRYEPGKRCLSWIKCKASQQILCAIIGYEPSEERILKSLIIAAAVEGELRWVGQVGSGISQAMHERLLKLLKPIVCKKPIVSCTIKGVWVEPALYCRVSFLEWTAGGKLRGPVFEALHDA